MQVGVLCEGGDAVCGWGYRVRVRVPCEGGVLCAGGGTV